MDMDWEKLKAYLEGLSPEQLKLVLDLVEQMKKASDEDKRVDSSDYRPDIPR